MWKTHKVLLLFCLTPLAVFTARRAFGEETAPMRVAVWIEARTDSETFGKADKNEKEAEGNLFLREVEKRLGEHEGAVQFVFFSTEEEVRQEVSAARAECGYCIPADFKDCLDKKRLKNVIKAYKSPQTSMQRLCEEVFFAEIFSVYGEMTFGEQAAELIGEENTAEAAREQIAARAEELLEKYLANGSTFQFVYEDYTAWEKDRLQGTGEAESGAEEHRNAESSGFFRVRGIMALLIFAGGLCGTLDVLEDEKQKRSIRLKGGLIFRFLTIYLPVFIMSTVMLVCLAVAGEWSGLAKELVRLGSYQLILLPYCFFLKHLCGTQERLSAAIPVLLLLTAVVCPVFADLAQVIPAFRILEKIFPAAYYLNM